MVKKLVTANQPRAGVGNCTLSNLPMNSDNPIEALQTGFRVCLGATTSLIESLQDAQKREETVSKIMRSEFGQLTEEWVQKGELTEQEARNFVDSLLNQPKNETANPTTTTSTSGGSSSATTPVAPPDVQLELQELTAQIAAMRAELEKLRNQETQS